MFPFYSLEQVCVCLCLYKVFMLTFLLSLESILPSISAHIVANVMGLPALSTELKEHPGHKLRMVILFSQSFFR